MAEDWDAEERLLQSNANEAFELMKVAQSKVMPTISDGRSKPRLVDQADLAELNKATAVHNDAQAKLKAFFARRRREDPSWTP